MRHEGWSTKEDATGREGEERRVEVADRSSCAGLMEHAFREMEANEDPLGC